LLSLRRDKRGMKQKEREEKKEDQIRGRGDQV
jgi:hypothetical protein